MPHSGGHGGGGGHHGGGGGHHSGGRHHHGGGGHRGPRGWRGGSWYPGYVQTVIYADPDCVDVLDPKTGKVICVYPNSGLGFWPFSSSDDASGDQASGERILEAYFSEASTYPDFQYTDFSDFTGYLESLVPGFVANVGELVRINYASTNESQAKDRMGKLAVASQGQANVGALTMAAGGSGNNVNWTAGIPEISANTASDTANAVTDVAVSVGQGTLATLNLVKYLPWILGIGGAIYLYSLGGGGIKTHLKSLAGKIKK